MISRAIPAILPRNGRSLKKWPPFALRRELAFRDDRMVAHLLVIASPKIREGWARSRGVGDE